MDTIGFVPAAGLGQRMQPFLLLKELLPVKLANESVGLLFENSFESLVESGINNVLCTINDKKDDLKSYIIRYSKKKDNINISFLYQDISSDRYGIPYSINDASPFLLGKTVIMRFPDTILTPKYCISEILSLHRSKSADLTLGVFPTKHPHRLGPVLIGEDNRVLKIEDKPEKPCASNTWNCVIWEDTFLKETISYVKKMQKQQKELLLFDIMNLCLDKGMKIYAKLIENGQCQDYSSIDDFINSWSKINDENEIVKS